tara:strand:+ start:9031 stop:9315 length:285 start_codon:yes stop_codon:yes gene_type:complete
MAETERHFDLLQGLIDKAFRRFYKGEEGNMTLENSEELKPMGAVARSQAGELFESIEDYTQKTGKRFRMTKDQKHRGLSREEAFKELYGEKNNG